MSLGKSFLIINISELFFIVSSYFIHVYLGRVFTPEEYGRYNLIIMLSTMTIVFIGDGVPKALSKYISQYPKKEKIIKRKAAILQFIIVTFVTAAYYFLAPFIADLLNDETLIPLIRLSTLIIPAFAAASFYNNYFNGLKKFGMQAAQRSIRSLSRFIAILTLAYFFSVKGAISGYIIAPLLVFIFSFFADKNRNKKIEGDFSYKELLFFGLRVISFMLAFKLMTSIDMMLIKRYLNDDYWTGMYATVIVIGQIPFYFFSNLAFLMLPTISNLLEEKTKEHARQLIQSSMRYIILLIIPTVVSVVVFSRQIIRFLYSEKYIDSEPALRIFVVGVGALTIFFICTFILNGSNNVKKSAVITWIGLLINLSLNVYLIPKMGIKGAAISTLITSGALMFISLKMVREEFGRFLKVDYIFKAIIAVMICFFFFEYIDKTIVTLIPQGISFFLLYFFILALLKVFKEDDIQKLKDIFFKKRKKRKIKTKKSERKSKKIIKKK